MIKVFICLCISILSAALSAQITSTHYKIYDVKNQKTCSLETIVQAMNSNDILLFGEEHNDSVAHHLQMQVFELLYKQFGNNIALSMEMFDRDVQLVLNEYLADKIKERHFKKDARVWSNYINYRPLVEFAKANNISITAANAASRYSNLAGREGLKGLKSLPKMARQNFAPLPFDTASGAYHEKLSSFFGLNEKNEDGTPKPPAMHMQGFNMIVAQSLWDATMAYSIVETWKKNRKSKILHLNGRFHSDEKMAVYTQLKKYAPKARVLVISCFADEQFAEFKFTDYQKLGDFIIVSDPIIPKTYE